MLAFDPVPVLATILGILAVAAFLLGYSIIFPRQVSKTYSVRAVLWLIAVACGYACGYLMEWWA